MQYRPEDLPIVFIETFPEFAERYEEFHKSLPESGRLAYLNAGEIACYLLDMVIDGHRQAQRAVELIDDFCTNGNDATLEMMQVAFFEEMHLILMSTWERRGKYVEKRETLLAALPESLRGRYLKAEEYFRKDARSQRE